MTRTPRTPLAERTLPSYSRGEEIANMITHIVGGALGIAVLTLSVIIAALDHNVWGVVGSSIYGASMICLYGVSSIYHGLHHCIGKKVMQVIDHCTIYFLIAGTYTPILLAAIRPEHPALAWTIFGIEWGIAAMAATFTAIDPNKYLKLSMACYIGMGWCIVIALKATVACIGIVGFSWLLAGGISYTVGAVLYGVGKKKNTVFHTVFHVFVVLGSLLQAVSIMFFVL